MEIIKENYGWVLALIGALVSLGKWIWDVSRKQTTLENKVMELTAQMTEVKNELGTLRTLLQQWKEENIGKINLMEKVLTRIDTTLEFIQKDRK